MTDHHLDLGGADGGEQLVHRPRASDAVGRTLRTVFTPARLPSDWQLMLDRMDATTGC